MLIISKLQISTSNILLNPALFQCMFFTKLSLTQRPLFKLDCAAAEEAELERG